MTQIPDGHFLAQSTFNTPSVGGPAVVVTGHQRAFGEDADECARRLAEDAWDASGSLLDRMDSSTSLIEVVTYLRAGPGDPFIGSWTGSLVGGQPGPAAPPQVAVLLQKQSGLAGRRNRGRMYVPSVVSSNIDEDGTLDSGAQTAWNAAAGVFLAACLAQDIDLQIFHETGADTPTLVTALVAANTVATQRRRLR